MSGSNNEELGISWSVSMLFESLTTWPAVLSFLFTSLLFFFAQIYQLAVNIDKTLTSAYLLL